MGAQKVLLDGIEEAREYGGSEVRWEHDPMKVDGLLAQKTSAGKGYFVTDALGSAYGVVDASGAVVSKYGYDVYGARTAVTEGMATSWGFTGRRHDGAGEMYYRERYLAVTIGTFQSDDSMGRKDGASLFDYVAGNPANWVDPSGKFKIYIIGINPVGALPNPTQEAERKNLEKANRLAVLLFGSDDVYFNLDNADGSALRMAADDPETVGIYLSAHGSIGIIAVEADGATKFVAPEGLKPRIPIPITPFTKARRRAKPIERFFFSACQVTKEKDRWAEALGGVFKTVGLPRNIYPEESATLAFGFYRWLERIDPFDYE